MSAEAPATPAVVSLRLLDSNRRERPRRLLVGDIEQPGEVWSGTTLCQLRGRVVLTAVVRARRLGCHQQQVALAQRLMALESGDRHVEDWKRGVRALVGRHMQVADLRREQLFWRRLQR